VYRAEDPELEMDVALKVLKAELADEPATVERFRREASMAAKLRHPNVVTVLTVGRLEEPFDQAPVGTPYLVMDYLPTSLGGRLRERGTLPRPTWSASARTSRADWATHTSATSCTAT
jgi:serine/threonine protein kinase